MVDFFQEGSKKVRFEYCETSRKDLVYVRAIQGHSGGETIAHDFMGHVLLPTGWKDIQNHKGCVFNMKSIVANGLIPGNELGRQTVFSLHSIHWNQLMKKKSIMTMRDNIAIAEFQERQR